ncbi:family A G protein-coupled receptor-like protein [Conidiobolus coronatus NRRL 28638]|uniref:Family A G protein-coupled receptor-like protein n=1 Tax=Conidiobolus coronatus (strain ATCC 28846 / CBS 209.66 / NRRL 28638) TaxID=796925 RepID=A0A137NUT1_CONC2|nr:family A G protein-coupled receptor-like protein [Conidiobolus coronatus NRRL 28638]|eukprot:KXN66575.1 family A G protein-coupled receptor-like protein [Conidiobolus coronatus NRRL 28638]
MEYEGTQLGLLIGILEFLASILSLTFNSVLIYILVNKMKLTQSDTVISFILCILDSIYSLFSLFNMPLIWATNYSIIKTSTAYCQLNGFVFGIMGISIVETIMVLGVLRYLAICKGKLLKIRTWVIIEVLLVQANVGLGLYTGLTNSYEVQPSLKYCASNPISPVARIVYGILVIISVISVIIIIFSYLSIAKHYRSYIKGIKKQNSEFINLEKLKSSLEVQQRSISSSELVHDFANAERKVINSIKKLYLMLSIYLLQIVPYLTLQAVYKLSNSGVQGEVIDNLVAFLAHFLPLTNPLFILFFHEETNIELKHVLVINWYRFKKMFYK